MENIEIFQKNLIWGINGPEALLLSNTWLCALPWKVTCVNCQVGIITKSLVINRWHFDTLGGGFAYKIGRFWQRYKALFKALNFFTAFWTTVSDFINFFLLFSVSNLYWLSKNRNMPWESDILCRIINKLLSFSNLLLNN